VKQIAEAEISLLQHNFSSSEVLDSVSARTQRNESLYLAMLLGNNYSKKVRLVTKTEEEFVNISAVVLAVTDTQVFLKGGNKIPVGAISEVHIY
jgi:hypothetical protein